MVHRATVPGDTSRCPLSASSVDSGGGQVEVSAQADVRERVEPLWRPDDCSWKESPAVASSCLRSFLVESSFAKGAGRESVEAVRVADVGDAEGGDRSPQGR